MYLCNESLQTRHAESEYIQTQLIKSELLEYLKISITRNDLNKSIKTVMVFPDMEYTISFFDIGAYTRRTVTGLVTKVYKDQIKIKTIRPMNEKCNCQTNTETTSAPMPNCNCVLNPPDTSKYDEFNILFIPIQNITNVDYVMNNKPPKNHCKEDIRIMLLGISANIVKAIVVRLDFIEENLDDAIKYVELHKGGIYDLCYETRDGTLFESRVKLMDIEEVPNDGTCGCRSKYGYVREHVGCSNAIYTRCHHDKDDFLMSEPVRKIKLIVDTSEDFEGRYEAIMLDMVRDCKEVIDGNDQEFIIYDDICKCCPHKCEGCDPLCCDYHDHPDMPPIPPKPPKGDGCGCGTPTYEYTYKDVDNSYKAVVNGEDVTLTIKGKDTKLSLDELIKYYLGI